MRKCLLLFIVFCTYCFSNAFTQTITFSHVSPTCPGTSNLGQVTASSLTSLGTGTYNVTWNGIVVSTISLVNGSGVSPAFNTSNFESGTFPFVISTFSSSINFIVQSTSTPTITCSTNINVNNSTGQCQAYVTVPSPTICSVLQLGNGLNFDGIDDVVSVPSTSVINQQNFQRRTVEVSFRVNNSASSTKQVIWEEGGSNNGINIYIEAGRLYYGIWSNTQSWTGVWLSTTLINNNQWHSAALVYDGTISNGTLKAFLDGVLVESANKSLGVLGDTLSLHTGANAIGAILNQTRFHDGANNGTNTNYFGGDIDELRLWTIARTATEIKSSRNIQLSGSETGLIIYYDFNQGTACGNNTSITTLPNRTATTGLNGTLTNFALTSCTSNWSTGFRILNYLASLTNSFNNTSNASDNYPIGNTIVTWTATDSSGNITTCNQTITVVDNQSPVLTSCPANVTLCGSQVVNYSLPTATDNCSVIVTQTAGLPSGSTFPVGTTTNTFTLADPSGNSVSCSFTVTINTAPTITTQPSTPAATCSGTGTQTMSVVATGTNLTYQWRRNSVNLINGGVISGATTPTLTLTNPTSADEGSYDVVVSGTCTPTATSNAVTVTTSPSALNFDGSNDSLVVPYFSKLNTNLLTVECWVKPTSGNQSGSIIATWPINAGPNSSFNGFGFRQRNDAQGGPGTEHFRFALGNDGTGNVVNSTIKPVADTWFHLAATYDGSVIKLYVNGIFQNQTTSTRIINSPENLSIGKLTSGTQLFNGTIDEIRIWDRVLCVSEIQNNMNCELPSGQVGLIAYYKLNSGCVGVNNSGLTTAFDASGNNNNGTLYNFALNGATSNWVAGNTTGSCSNFSIPDVPSTVTASSTNICSGQTLNLSAISTNNTINWFTTPYAGSSVGSSASGANFAVTPNTNTTYYAEAINASSCTSASRTPITIKVNQLSVLDQPSNQILCNGISSTPVLFSSSNINTVYNWTNNNNAIGLASNGVGDINSFNAVNSSSIPIVSTVSTTPSTGNGSNAYAYIANYDNSTVQVINTSTSSIVSTINVGLNPVALIINNENSKVYVANRGSNTVSVINTSTNTVLSTINVGTQPYGLAISNDDTRLYVINRTSETVSAINLQTNQILNTIVLGVGSSPSSAILNNDGSKLYLVNNGSTYNSVSVINTVSNTITNTIPVGTRPYQITISQDGTKLFVSNNTGSSVSVINTSTETVVSTITVGSGPRGLVLNQDATKLYVVNRNSNSVSIINTSNNVVTNTIDIGLNTNPYGISLTHDGNYLFVTNQTSNNVSKINTKTLLSEATIGVSAIPYSNGRFITAGSPFCSGVSKQFSITVNPTPQGSISGNTICNGGTGQLTFTATSGTGPFTLIINGETYSSISSGVSFNVTNNPTTTTNYTLTSITDANNCVRTSDFTNANASITVNPTPQGSISGNTICNGGTGQLTFTSSFGTGPFTLIINGVSYSSITSGVAFNVTNNPTTTTNYTLTSITDANNCVRTNNFTNANASITVNAVPTALINTNGPTTFCEGGSVTLTANQSPANGNSLVLNGTNRIEGGHNSPLNILGSLTIEAWINHSSRTVGQWYHTQEIAGKNQDTHNGFYGLLYDGSSGNYYFLIKFDQGHSSAAFPISNIPLNTWKHITGVYNSSTKTVAIYLDGILKSSTNVNAAWTRTSTTTTSPFTIGNMPTYNGYPFMGKIDEVRVWNIARSASEIAENYNRIVNPQSTGIVGYYKLDNNSNNQYVDASLNAIHLTAVNNPSLEIPSTAPLYSSILWNNNSISQSLLVTNNTNHNFTATNSFGCSAISQTEIITVNPTPQGSISGNTICNGGTGQLTFTSSFGTGPFTLIINGVSYSSITSGVAFNVTNNPTTTTNYTLTSITDANSCVRTSDFTNANATITVNPLTAITVQPSAVVYCKDATATPLSVTATGTGTITYQWFSNSTNSTTGASSVGNTQTYTPATTTVGTTYYFAVVHSDCGPDITSNIVAVTINTIPQGSISGNTICNGGTGQLTFTATSGTGPFTLIINGETYSSITSGVAFNVTNNPTTTTNYTLTSVTDANSCVRTSDFTNASATITVNPLTAISVQPTGATYCKDATATALSVTATGTGTITYQWFSNSTNSTSGASSVGNAQTYTPATTTVGTTYYFAVVHSDCGPDITSNIVAVTINAIPQGSISGNTICNGGTGQLTFTSTSGTGPFTLIINGETYSSISSGVAFNVTNNPTTTTNYTLTSVTDANNCVRTSDFTNANASITVNTAPSITTQPITPAATCSGSGTQNLSVVATGTNLTYQWRRNNVNLIDGSVISGATTSTLTLTNPTTADAGNYDVVVSGTCSPSEISNAITVTVHAIPQGSLSGNTICSGGTGQLTFLASSGADPQTLVINGYTYSPITNGVPFNAFPNPTNTNTYTLTSITDINGCIRTSGITNPTTSITINPLPTVSPITSLSTIEVLAVGGGGGSGGNDGPNGAGGGAGAAVYGKYNITGTSIAVAVGGGGGAGSGCFSSAPGGSGGTNGGGNGGNAGYAGCSGGGGGGGGWSGIYQGSNYIVVAGGGAGGGGSNEGTANDVSTPGGGNQTSSNGSSLTGGNGANYSGDGGGGGGGGGGFYGGLGQLILTSTGNINSRANGGGNLLSTTNRIAGTIYNGSDGASTNAGAAGGSAVIVSNASDFLYSNNKGAGGTGKNNPSNPGTNGVVIIRYLGAPQTTGGTITQSGGYTLHTFTTPGISTFTIPTSSSVCVGSTITLSSATSGGVWSSNNNNIATIDPSSGILTGVSSGSVTITYTITDGNGCSNSVNTIVAVNAKPTAIIIETDASGIANNDGIICSGATANLNASSSTAGSGTITSYLWNTNATTSSINTSTAGNYSVTITNSNGCSTTSSNYTITVTPNPTINSTTPAARCSTGTVILNATSTLSDINWYTASTGGASLFTGQTFTTPSLTNTTTYYVDATDANNCVTPTRTAVIATINPLPTISGVTGSTICSGTAATLTASSSTTGPVFKWYDQSSGGNLLFTGATYTTPILTSNTAYYVEVTNSNNCSSATRTTVNVTVNPLPTVSISPNGTLATCSGSPITLTASGASSYIWNSIASTTPLDGVSSSAALAVGLRKLRSAYSGNALRLRRSSDNVEQDFGFSGTELDIASINTFLGASSGFIRTLYDQSGSGRNMTQTTNSLQPLFVASGLNGKPTIRISASASQTIFNTTNFSAPFTVIYGSKQLGPTRGRLLTSYNASSNWLLGYWNGLSGQAYFEGWVYGAGSGPSNDSNPYVYTGAGSGSLSQFYQNGSLLASNSNGNSGPNGISMGPGGCCSNEKSDADFTELFIFNSVLSTNDRQTIENSTGTYYGIFNSFPVTAAITVSPTTTTNYTVTGTNSFGCSSQATQTITVNPLPVISSVSGTTTICSGNSTTLTANSSATTPVFKWYNALTNGTLLFTGPSYTTASLTSSTTFYVEVTNDISCTSSPRTAVLVTVIPLPTISSITGTTTICSGNTTTLTANSGTTGPIFKWYDDPTSGNLLFTGATYTTPSLTTNTTYYVEVTNSNNCISSSRTAVTVTVNVAAEFTVCPSNQTANTILNACNAIINYNVTSTGTPTPNLTYSFTGATTGSGSGTGSGLNFNIGVTNVIITAANSCGTPTCSFTVTVLDNQPPTITCDANVSVNNSPNQCNATVTVTAPSITDNCSSGSSGNALSFDGSNDYVVVSNDLKLQLTTGTIEARIKTNNAGGSHRGIVVKQSAFALFLKDNILGTYNWSTGSDISTGINLADGNWHHVAMTFINGLTNGSKIYLDGNLIISFTYNIASQGQGLAIGAGGTSAFQNFTGIIDEVRIWNTIRTQSQIQANVNTELDAQTGLVAVYHFNQGVAGGNNTGINTAIDASGNNLNGTLNGFALTGATSNWVASTLSSSTITLVNNFNNTNNASGTYPVGVTNVIWTATDVAGNSSTCTQTVTVIDNQAPTINCPSNISVIATSTAGAVVTYSTPVGTDNCSSTTTRIAGLASGATFPIGVTTVTHRVTDASGLTAQCSFTVTVEGVAPSIDCPSDITINTATGLCSATVNFAATETTGYPASTITYSQNPGTSFPVGVTTVTATATNSVASSSCNFTITVVDNESPVFTSCPSNMVLCGSQIVNFATPTATDNCSSIVTQIAGLASGSTFPIGTTTNTFRAIDPAGNITLCSFTVTINPIPVLTQPNNITVCNNSSTSAGFTSDIVGTVFNWTATTNNIGLATTGTGNILPFTATNISNALENSTITVIPSYTNQGLTCSGDSKSFTITVNPTVTVTTVGNQTLCNGTATNAVNLSSPTTVGTIVYNWTNSLPSIGLDANGTGDIASFTAINTTNAPVTATITVTPTFTNNGVDCIGTATTFTITVNPTPSVNSVYNQTVCVGTTTIFSFGGTSTSYNWTNDNSLIGLSASGTDDISFTAVNSSTTPITGNFVVTPVYTNNAVACNGTATSFSITVNPTATVNTVANQTLCNGVAIDAVNFSSPNSGGTIVYNWTNSLTSIGLAASGTGDIASFTAVNTTNATVIATITVTPTFTNNGVDCIGIPYIFTITVNPTPLITSTNSPVYRCGAGVVLLTATESTGTGTINWFNTLTGGNVLASGPSYSTTINGNPIFYVSATNLGCTSPTRTAVITSSGPIYTALSTQCLTGNNFIFVNTCPTAGATYIWNFGDGTTFTGQTPPVKVYTQAGNYNVELITRINGIDYYSTLPIVVKPMPSVSFYPNPNSSNGAGYTFISTSTIASGIMNYAWDFGDGSTSSGFSNPQHTYTTSGTYTVKLTVTSDGGCVSETSQTITVTIIPGSGGGSGGSGGGGATIPAPAFNVTTTQHCVVGNSFTFTVASTDPVGTSYQWNFGDGNTSLTAPITSHSYAAAGYYNVVLKATLNGIDYFTNQQVIVKPMPTASFNYTNSGLHYNFFSTSTLPQGSMYYNWDFGASGSSTAQNPQVVLTSNTSYNITLTVTSDGGCVDAVTQSFTTPISGANATPKPGFIITSAAQQCIGNPISNNFIFNDTSRVNNPSGATYSWNFGDGNSLTGVNATTIVSHSYAAAGYYNVVLKVTYNGNDYYSNQQVIVKPMPTASFNYNNTFLQYNFFSTSSIPSGGMNYSWDFGAGGSSTSQNPQVTFPSAATYAVTLTVTSDGGCIATATQSVVVTGSSGSGGSGGGGNSGGGGTNLSVGFSVNTSQQCLTGNNYTFTNTGSYPSGTTFLWNLGNGTTFTTTNVSNYVYPTAGYYNVVLKATYNGYDHYFNQQVIVKPMPVAGFTFSHSNNSTYFTNTSTLSQGSMSFDWTLGTFGNSNTQNPVASFANNSNNSVTLLVTSDGGCTSSITQNVFFSTSAPAGFTVNNATQCLSGNNFVFTNTSSAGSGISYSWNFGDGSNAQTTYNASHTYTSAGAKTVVLTVNNNGVITTASQNINVNMSPTADYSFVIGSGGTGGENVTFTNTSTNASTYQWTEGASTLAIAAVPGTPSAFFLSLGIHPITLTASQGSCSATVTKTITIGSLPVAAFSVSSANAQCVSGNNFTFTNTSTPTSGSSSITNYAWNFGDGSSIVNTTSPTAPSHSYTTSGNYTITLTVTNGVGTHSATQAITVKAAPTASFVIYNRNPAIGNSYTYSSTSTFPTGNMTYSWDMPGASPSSSTLINPDVTYATPGNYNITLTVTGSTGCSVTSSVQSITYCPSITASFTAPATTSMCLNNNSFAFVNSTTTNDPGASVLSYAWNFGDVALPTVQSTNTNPTKVYTAAGTYHVNLVATLTPSVAGCAAVSNTAIQYNVVTVNPIPTANFSASVNYNGDIYSNPTVSISNSSVVNPAGASPYNWATTGTPSIALSGTTPSTYTYSTGGTKNIILTATNSFGCSASITKSVSIVITPKPAISVSKVDNGNGTTTFNITGFSNPSNPSSIVTGTIANYTIRIDRIINGGPAAQHGNLVQNADATFTIDNSELPNNNFTATLTLTSDLGVVSTKTTPEFGANLIGTGYYVYVKPPTTTSTPTVVLPPIRENFNITPLVVYPNPSQGRFVCSFISKENTAMVLKVYDLVTGKEIKNQYVMAKKGTNQVLVEIEGKRMANSSCIVTLTGDQIHYQPAKILIMRN